MAASPAGLLVQLGHNRFDPATPELEAAIQRENGVARIEGLPDNLNPAIIDLAKTRALLGAMSQADAAALGGKALLLSPALLRIGASAPTTPSSFAAPVAVTVVDTHGTAVSARAAAKVDCALARHQASAARTAFAAAEQGVARQEAANPSDSAGLVALSDAKTRRFAIATVWKENAAAARDCTPADQAAQQEYEAAGRAVSATIQAPQSGGMPSN